MDNKDIVDSWNSSTEKSYGILEGFIKGMEERYGVFLNIHDIMGVSSIDPDVRRILSPFYYHNNTFCNFIKKSRSCYEKCVINKGKLCTYCREFKGAFIGKCYFGVEEIIYPIYWGENLIMIICVSLFRCSDEITIERIKTSANKYGVNEELAVSIFKSVTNPIDFKMEHLYMDIGILGDYLLQIYKNYINLGKSIYSCKKSVARTLKTHQNNHIVDYAIEFINQNYHEEISLNIIAANSYCNASYLSYIFKEKMKINLTDYINTVRVNAASYLLDTSTISITEIGVRVGYGDAAYFSRCFKKLTGYSPTEYRKRGYPKNSPSGTTIQSK